jgi:hypothetical protein
MAMGASIGAAVRDVTARAKRLAKLQTELARAEIQAKGRAFAIAIGMFVAAAMLAFFTVALLVALVVAALAIVLPVWLAILIALVAFAAAAATLAAIGARSMKRSGAPVPVRAIAQMKRTQGAVRDALRRKQIVMTETPPDLGSVISAPKTDGATDAP